MQPFTPAQREQLLKGNLDLTEGDIDEYECLLAEQSADHSRKLTPEEEAAADARQDRIRDLADKMQITPGHDPRAASGAGTDDLAARQARAAALRRQINDLASGKQDQQAAETPRQFTDRKAREAAERAGRQGPMPPE